MSAVAIMVIGVIVGVALFVLGGAIWFAWDSDKRVRAFARSTDLIPGKPGRAPDEWATATSPPALLHQRIRYAIADVHRVPTIPDSADALAARDRLDNAVFGLDDQLIAAAERDAEPQRERLAEIDTVIVSLEELATKVWDAEPAEQVAELDAVTEAINHV